MEHWLLFHLSFTFLVDTLVVGKTNSHVVAGLVQCAQEATAP